MMEELARIPDVSFIDGITLDDVQTQLVSLFRQRYEEITNKPLVLRKADPRTRFLYAIGEIVFHSLEYVDRAGKQDLVKYSYGAFLDNLAAFWGLTRNPFTFAQVTMRFTVSEIRPFAVSVPQGTRVTNGNNIFFATDEYAEIPAGASYTDVTATCTTAGTDGNFFEPGTIRQIVDPVAYIGGAFNLDESSGGADVEDDDQLRTRVFLAPASYSTAGPRDAYIFHTLDYSSAIGSCNVSSPTPGDVVIRVLMKDGTLPSATLCQEIYEHLSEDTIRPLTDHVLVMPPETQPFDVDVSFWISRTDADQATTLQREIADAVQMYAEWQQGAIGRDINPSELIAAMMNAGAKRVEVRSPVYTVVPSSHVPRLSALSTTYGGIEDE